MGWQDGTVIEEQAQPAWMSGAVVDEPQPTRIAQGVGEALRAGYQASATGLMLRGKLPDVVLDPQHSKWYEKMFASIGQLASDVPEMAVGARVGGATGFAAGGPVGGVLGAGAGAFAIPAAIRESLTQAYSKGAVTSSGDFLNRASIVLKQTGKEALIGAATFGAGAAASRVVGGALAPAIGESISIPVAKTAIGTAQTAAEVGTMVVAPAALEGRLPEPEDFVNAALVVAFAKGATGLAGNVASGLRSTYARTGIRPEQVVADAKADPEIGNALAKGEMPKAYEPMATEEVVANSIPDPVKVQEVVTNLPGTITDGKEPNHINYRYVNEPQDIQAIHARISEVFKEEIESQRGAPKSWDESAEEARQALADSLGVNAKTIQRGSTSLDAEIMARNAMMQRAAYDVAEAARVVREAGDQVTEQQVRAMQGSIETLSAVQQSFLGNAAELGRALNALKAARQTDALAADLKALRERFGDDPHLIAKMIGELGTVEKISKFAKEATVWEKMVEAWKAGILSGPVTHIANLIGNTTFMAMRPVVDITAAAIGKLTGADERVAVAEPFGRIFGNLQGARDAALYTAAALRTAYEEGGVKGVAKEIAVGKEEAGPQKAEQFRKAIGGVKGDIIRLPFRFLSLADAFFKTMNERGEAYALASRKALSEGLNLQTREFRERVVELVQNPTVEMQAAIHNAGLRYTFNLPLGEVGQSVSDLVRKAHLQMFVPFVRTPGNILKELARMTPLSPAVAEWRADWKAGGAARQKAVAELVTGSALMSLVAGFAMDSEITGQGNPDPNKKRVAMAAGWQPYSIKVGDTYYSYQRVQPLGTLMGLAADMSEIWDHMTEEEQDKVPKMIAAAFANAVTNQTFLQGITNIVNAMSDPKRFVPRLAQNMAGSLVPNIVGQPTTMADPYTREVNSMLDAIRSRIPVLRGDMMKKVDAFGTPVQTKERLGGLSPVTETTVSQDKVRTEAERLNVGAAEAPKKVHLGRGTGKLGEVEISPEQRNKYAEVAGQTAHALLAPVVNSPSWEGLSPLAQKRIFQRAFTLARKQAVMQTFTGEERQALMGQINEKVQEALTE